MKKLNDNNKLAVQMLIAMAVAKSEGKLDTEIFNK